MGIQDSIGFWIPRRGFRIPGAGFQILCQWNLDSGFQIPIVRGIPDSLSCIPDLLQQYFSWPQYPLLPHEQEKLQRLQIAAARPNC